MAPEAPTFGKLSDAFIPPAWIEGGSSAHLLGTDSLGRDVYSRIIYGARVSLVVSIFAIFIAGSIGTVMGLASGYFGGRLDGLIMRLVDIALALPTILIALVLVAVLQPGIVTVIVVIGCLSWANYARQIRGEVLTVKERDFVVLARSIGSSPARIMSRHILPNVFNTIIVLATLQVGSVILLEATLSFLGLGVPPPEPSWGQMVAEGRAFIVVAWWMALFPGLAIMFTVLSMNLMGDWLRDLLDPRLRQL
ncbi:MAG: ABC transporter permease [Chloroflexi bacterium]|nr:ABC transporter permease [Chloroflexota bacterium]